jgi:hypothetical protein
MAGKKLPKSAKDAEARHYIGIAGKHSAAEKRKWVLVKQKRNWTLARAASSVPTGPHTVCYYDPNTGFYDDCHQSP